MPKTKASDFVNKLLSYLKIGGNMFITVPLGQNQPSNYNEYHLNEPSIDILYDLFIPYFENITFEIDTFVNSFGFETKYCLLLLKSFKGECI